MRKELLNVRVTMLVSFKLILIKNRIKNRVSYVIININRLKTIK